MIEWMQTHRKWLVITIWIATIAFVGAGFVGWGQFQFGKKTSTIAKVKDTEITIQDWQNAYNNLFDRVNQQLGGKLDEATAKKLGLQKEALDIAIQQGILRQYAKDLGLYVTDNDIAKKILEVFKNKQNYENYLKNTGQKAKDFENNLRKQLLVEKLLKYLNLKPQKTEIMTIASALYNADNLDIKVINKNNIKVDVDENEIKKYWEKNKNKYLSQNQYKIMIETIPLEGDVSEEELKKYYNENKLNYKNEKGEILSFEKAKNQVKIDYLAHKLKKKAIIAYKNLKNSKGNYKIITVNENNKLIPFDKMQILKNNGYLKPFVYNQQYITAKLIEELKPTPLPFEKVKNIVIKDYINEMSSKKLIEIANKTLQNFKGKNIGYVTKYDFNKIKNLPPNLAEMFLMSVFISQKPISVIFLPNKNNPEYAVLYNIREQKLLDEKEYEKNKKLVYNLTQSVINNELYNDLLNKLKNKYTIVKYIKDNG
ncbi:hypothetical protein FE773_05730 [Caminibacter mediatlanticus TB-2]|uniref:PpiC domain-containing protein n=1 Tax=Caminibacter mediatlanticus TB-2 TaxID=391592 RepID=A0ABX5VAU2_9BACT|nr:peptidylprolyl isomerase [Caminibacter mediatlanticus]QCT94694.1 hypothetical protein FE773_05730 [Caminibacter mediatlanticus TB-2]